ncbi:hypothetical protein HOC37_03110 [bacterium]|jgi:UDP-N-acetyl-alpha-D-muramoyl-L-alanyl-L-glutamate epimerase|nr:hypothetical protein [bacterium]MBT3580950.1 hypothetical protein [bacterium]MBT4551956.1 hypothetical protein [bacterium]MBT5988526.1 hypothetical protein [bacterium]MBT7087425.1 hypothetical protein [bacterium]
MKYPEFIYKSYKIEKIRQNIIISFHFYLTKEIQFHPQITIPKKDFKLQIDLESDVIQNMVFNLGLIELISYWKATCSPKIIIEAPGSLNTAQIKWWKKLYFKGLGEFFYQNKIQNNVDDFVEIEIKNPKKFQKQNLQPTHKNLIPIGGGKDSIVTLETLVKTKSSNTPLILNPREASLKTCFIAGYQQTNILEIQRTIDPKLLDLNQKGFLNGHTPFSALLAFTSLLCAALFGYEYIVLSNEASANEATIPGTSINHQYSKSFEFEKDFKNYVANFIVDHIHYFSLLRRFNELQIAQKFSQLNKQYFTVFRSCNKGSKNGIWCCNCPKCLFVYIMFSAFLSPEELLHIFGNNLFENAKLLSVFQELIGATTTKPFECVGTYAEINAALSIILQKSAPTKALPLLLKYYKKEHINLIKSKSAIKKELTYFNQENLIPNFFN